jgi:hypothetical protein
MSDKKVTVLDVAQAKAEGRKLVMCTAYDYPMGLLADQAGMDMVLVGDSLGMVVMGLERHRGSDHGGHDPPHQGGGAGAARTPWWWATCRS